jgi:diaminopimelate decarboxylase
MDHFQLIGGAMNCEGVALAEIAAAVGTPVYVYSTATMVRHAAVMRAALAPLPDPLIAYAVKANPNAAVLATLARAGLGADIVSGGEYARARAAGIPAGKIVFSGVGKTEPEMAAALKGGLYQFNLESDAEAETLSAVAASLGLTAPVGFRVNPDVKAGTHAKISTGGAENKFGIPIDTALAAYRRAAALPGLAVQGVAVHIGSQLIDLRPLEAAFTRVGALIAELRAAGLAIAVADLGGGLGIPHNPALPDPPSPSDYGAMVRRIAGSWGTRLVFEPGRLIVGNAGILLSRVIRVKPGIAQPFLIVDAAMNDLMPGALRCLARDRGGRAARGADDRERRRPGLRERRHLRDRARDGPRRSRRPRPVPHRRRLCCRDVEHLQQPPADPRSARRRRPLGGRAPAGEHRRPDRRG